MLVEEVQVSLRAHSTPRATRRRLKLRYRVAVAPRFFATPALAR